MKQVTLLTYIQNDSIVFYHPYSTASEAQESLLTNTTVWMDMVLNDMETIWELYRHDPDNHDITFNDYKAIMMPEGEGLYDGATWKKVYDLDITFIANEEMGMKLLPALEGYDNMGQLVYHVNHYGPQVLSQHQRPNECETWMHYAQHTIK